MQAIWQPWTANTRCSFCCSTCLRAIAPLSRGFLIMKDRQREVRARSRAVAAAQHARSKSAGSPESLKEEDTPQIGSRPLRSQKSADQGQSHAQRQQRSSPQREPEAHASTESWHQPASSSHSMADTRWQLPTDKIGVVAGTRPARKAPVSHSNVDISRHSDLGHARLQRYWSALQKEKLHGEMHVTRFKAISAARVTRTDLACLHTLLQASTSCTIAKEAQQQHL